MTTETPPTGGSDDSHTRYYDADEPDQPLTAIVEAVSAVKGVDVRELEPLYYAIDIERLNGLAGRTPAFRKDSIEPAELTVSFEYEGCQITVGNERVTVQKT